MPPDITLHVGQLPRQPDLSVKLVLVAVARIGGVHDPIYILTDIYINVGGIVVPPFCKMAARRGLKVERPVELGSKIVDPSVFSPKKHVGIEIIVVLKPGAVAASWVAAFITPYPEGTYSKPHPWLSLLYRGMKLLYKEVNIMSAPFIAVHFRAKFLIARVVRREFPSIGGIRIEIIVDMNAVDVIAADDVADHVANEIAVLLIGRVEESLSVEFDETMGFLLCKMSSRKNVLWARRDAIWIQPCMKLHPLLWPALSHIP